MAGNSGEPGRTVTSKLAAILTAFTHGSDFTLSEIATQTDLAVSTTHRLLTDLVRTSLLERLDRGAYRPGPTLQALPCPAKPATLRARAPFVVEDLAATLFTSARLGVVDGLDVAYIEKRIGPEPGTLFPNPARLPLHATAMGKALLAFGARSLVRVVANSGLARYTARTITSASELECALQKVRTHGYAVIDGELQPNVRAVAVPVFDTRGRAIAAIEAEATGPSPAGDLMVPALLTAARCLRREIAPAEPSGRPVVPAAAPDGRRESTVRPPRAS
jgi:IclR family acetate operon transcriptional repressor